MEPFVLAKEQICLLANVWIGGDFWVRITIELYRFVEVYQEKVSLSMDRNNGELKISIDLP